MSVTGVSLYAASYSESGTAATDPMKNGGSGAFKPLPTQGYDANVYTIGGNWEAMESAGAVFLPVTNFRKGTIFDQYASGTKAYTFCLLFFVVKYIYSRKKSTFVERMIYSDKLSKTKIYG